MPVTFSTSLSHSLSFPSSYIHLSLSSGGISLTSLVRKSAKGSGLSCFLFCSSMFSPFHCGGCLPLRALLSSATPPHHLNTLFHFIHYSSYSFCHLPLSVQSCFGLSHNHLPHPCVSSNCPIYFLLHKFTERKN